MEEASETTKAEAEETKRIQPEQATNQQTTEAKRQKQAYHAPDTLDRLIGKTMGKDTKPKKPRSQQETTEEA